MNTKKLVATFGIAAGLVLGGTGIASADSVPSTPVGPAKSSFQSKAERFGGWVIDKSANRGERFIDKSADRGEWFIDKSANRACRLFIPSC